MSRKDDDDNNNNNDENGDHDGLGKVKFVKSIFLLPRPLKFAINFFVLFEQEKKSRQQLIKILNKTIFFLFISKPQVAFFFSSLPSSNTIHYHIVFPPPNVRTKKKAELNLLHRL